MNYAVCWLDVNRRIKGWSLHQDPKKAINFSLEDLGVEGVYSRAAPVYEVTVSKNDFEEDMFMATLSGGFLYFDEANPKWLHGSSSVSSKCYKNNN